MLFSKLSALESHLKKTATEKGKKGPDNHYKAISGKLLVIGYEPDGDSIRFKADDLADFDSIYRSYKLKPSRDESVQLRLDGIDAPELHYGGHGQPRGETARDYLLNNVLGFSGIKFNKLKVSASNPPEMDATILTSMIDPHGRPISYLLVGTKAQGFSSGEIMEVDVDTLEQTVNIQLLKKGEAYPLLYTSTPLLNREYIRELAVKSQDSRSGIWTYDHTTSFELYDYESIEPPNGLLIFPKIFRRAIDYLRDYHNGVFRGSLIEWMRWKGEQEDDMVLIDERFEVHLSDLLEQHNYSVTLKTGLLDVTFVER